MTDEIFDIVNEKDEVIGQATRKECHSRSHLIHRSVFILIINSKQKLMLKKRSMEKDLYPGTWEIVAGHVDQGESYEDAAKRELFEETGIKNVSLTKIVNFKKDLPLDKEFCMLFCCEYDGLITLDHESDQEAGVRYFSEEEVFDFLMEASLDFSPGSRLALEKYFEIFKNKHSIILKRGKKIPDSIFMKRNIQ